MLQKSDVESSRQDQTQLDSASESKKMSQSEVMPTSVCLTCSSKGLASWLWLVVFDPYFFLAEEPSPHKWGKFIPL